MYRGSSIGVTFRGRCSTWWSSSVTFCGRRSTWWSSSVSFCGRRSTWWSSSVTFRGRCSTWWSSSITFRGRCSTWWMLECKIGCKTLYFTIENACGELEKWGGLRTDGFSLGPCSDHARIGPALEMTFVWSVLGNFLWNVAVLFFVAGAIFGEVGWWHLLLRAL